MNFCFYIGPLQFYDIFLFLFFFLLPFFYLSLFINFKFLYLLHFSTFFHLLAFPTALLPLQLIFNVYKSSLSTSILGLPW